MKMPDTVYLFPTYFTISDTEREESRKYKGRTDYSKRSIRIDPHIHSEDQKSIMLHEIIHCILDSVSLKDHDEVMVEVLANGFLNIIRGNKDLIKWLAEVK